MIVHLHPAALTEIVLGRADIHLQVCVDTRVTCQECLFTTEEEVITECLNSGPHVTLLQLCKEVRASNTVKIWKFLVPYVEAQHNFLSIFPVGLLNLSRWVVTANDPLYFRISAFSWVHELFKCCYTHIFFMLMYLLNNHVDLYITMECLSYIVYLSRFLLHPHQRQVWSI